MKIVMTNFNYKEHFFDQVEFDLPNIYDVDNLFKENIVDYIAGSLNEFVMFNTEES